MAVPYSQRSSDTSKLEIKRVRELIYKIYKKLLNDDFFQEHWGLPYRVFNADKKNIDVGLFFELKVHHDFLWPIDQKYQRWSKSDIFDFLEIIYTCISEPVSTTTTPGSIFSKTTYSRINARREFISIINPIIARFDEGYIMNGYGQIELLRDNDFSSTEEDLPETATSSQIDERIQRAIRHYHHRGEDLRKEALKELGDVLEFIRAGIKANEIAKKVEPAIFDILNNYNLRHNNAKQNTNYNTDIWYDWMYHTFLATIKAVLKEKNENEKT